MSLAATYAPFGARPAYFTADGLAWDETAHALLAKRPENRAWDWTGVRNYLARSPDGYNTCFAGIRAVPPGHDLVQRDGRFVLQTSLPVELSRRKGRALGPQAPWSLLLGQTLEHAVTALLADGRRAAVALSGGLDSALLVAILRILGRDDITVFTLASGLPGYCERQVTAEAARRLGVKNLQVIEAGAEDMIATFADVIRAAEVPLFNLHPVHRWLLAKALRREGYEVLLTGDGADQVFAGSDPRNYLPIIGALTRAAGLELRSPFFDPEVLATAPPATPDKAALREAARAWLPDDLIYRPKTPTYAPALDVSRYWNEAAITDLARQLGVDAVKPGAGIDGDVTLWTSLGILADLLN